MRIFNWYVSMQIQNEKEIEYESDKKKGMRNVKERDKSEEERDSESMIERQQEEERVCEWVIEEETEARLKRE